LERMEDRIRRGGQFSERAGFNTEDVFKMGRQFEFCLKVNMGFRTVLYRGGIRVSREKTSCGRAFGKVF